MTVTTKKYALPKNTYVKAAFSAHMKTEWKWLLIPAAVMIIGFVLHFSDIYRNYWIPITALIGGLLYVAFWYVQFYGATQMDQSKAMFDKYIYEIDSRHILMKINAKEGGVIKWDMIQSAERTKDAFLLHMGKAQFLYLPLSIFNSENDIKLTETILKRKELL